MQLEFGAAPRPGLVSIIVPCYNAERFLAETLESAFRQTYPNTEVIIIDDGSTDGTANLIRSYSDRVRAEFGPNRGVSAARNRATALAQGEFLQYLDADDLLTPDAVANRVAALQRCGADVGYSDWVRLVEIKPGVFERGEQIVRRIEDVHPKVQIALITAFWAPLAAITYRRSIVEKIGGWKEWLPVIEDARFLQDAALVGGNFVYVHGIGGLYREHQGSRLSRRNGAEFISNVFRNACSLQDEFERRGTMSDDERVALAQIYDYTARSLFFENKSEFRACVARLYKVEPGFRLTWPKAACFASTVLGFKAAGMLLDAHKVLRDISHRYMLNRSG